MNVLVAGASSTVGRHVCALLRAQGHTVTGLSRTGQGLDADRSVAGDVTRPGTLSGCCEGIDGVISVVGAPVWPVPSLGDTTFEATDRDGNIALFTEAKRAGVDRVVYLSVFGDYPPGIAYVEAHRAVEDWLADSSLVWCAVRATGFFESFAVFRQLARTGVSVRIGHGDWKTNPIHEADLAAVLVDGLQTEGIVDCGGPNVLTRREIAELAFDEGSARLAPVPGPMVKAQALAVRAVSRRAGDVLVFLHHVATHDAVAPRHGTHHLADWLRP